MYLGDWWRWIFLLFEFSCMNESKTFHKRILITNFSVFNLSRKLEIYEGFIKMELRKAESHHQSKEKRPK